MSDSSDLEAMLKMNADARLEAVLDHLWLFIDGGKEVPAPLDNDPCQTVVVSWSEAEIQDEILRVKGVMAEREGA